MIGSKVQEILSIICCLVVHNMITPMMYIGMPKVNPKATKLKKVPRAIIHCAIVERLINQSK